MNVILEYVDEATLRSEIDVLIAITESYRKALSIISDDSYSNEIIQESFSVYMEDGEGGSSIANLFKKVLAFFKNVCAKIKGIFSRIFNTNQKYAIQSYNVLCIIGELNKIFSTKTFTEYMNGEITDEVFQEALFDKKSSQEKEEEEYMKGQVAREKELEKNVKSNDVAVQNLVKDLRKKVMVDERLTRMLSQNEVETITRVVCLGANKEELGKLRGAIDQIKHDNYEGIDKNIYKTLSMIVHTGRAYGEVKEETFKKSHAVSAKAKERANTTIIKDNTEKTVLDIGLLEKFADTFGRELNKLSGRDYFSAENLKAILYGDQKVLNVISTSVGFTVSTLFNLVTKAAYALATFKPQHILDDIAHFGSEIDAMDEDFFNFVDDDTVLRKECSIKLNKTMGVLSSGVLGNIREETYRWEDCPFNTLSYGKGNMMTMIAGGPITLTFIFVSMIFFHKPIENFYPGPGTLGMMGLARMLNPGRSGKYVNDLR